MKYLILLTSFLCGFEMVQAQVVFGNPEVVRKDTTGFRLTGSMQVGLGWIDPKDVNQYIGKYMLTNGFGSSIALANQLSLLKKYSISDFYIQQQNSLGLSLTVQPTNRLRVRLTYEFGLTPSNNITVSSGNADSDFKMQRNSVGVLSQYYFPIRKSNRLFVGAGVLRHYMTFEQFHAKATGFRFELGYNFIVYPLEADIFLYSDIAKGSITNQQGFYYPNAIDFSGIFLGIRITPWFN
jgi:outer membrane protein W